MKNYIYPIIFLCVDIFSLFIVNTSKTLEYLPTVFINILICISICCLSIGVLLRLISNKNEKNK